MEKNRVEEVFKKMVFLQDDINIKFIEVIIVNNVKSFIDLIFFFIYLIYLFNYFFYFSYFIWIFLYHLIL